MKAAVLSSPQKISSSPLQLEDISKPAMKTGHVLLRVRACGVCRTDLHIVEGELPPRLPHVIPGHQIVGEIVDMAEPAANLRRGDRVGVTWLGGVDGSCPYCVRHLE